MPATEAIPAAGGGSLVIRYQVLRAWKGVHADMVVTVTTGASDAACALQAELHNAYLVQAGTSDRHLTAGLCFLSHRSDQDTGDFDALGAPRLHEHHLLLSGGVH
jgi:hypothetical protein